jgi:hypothetical protein
MLFFMVKLKVCRTTRAIFRVKGHTKNDCDRMFNLLVLKYDYRKVNCYTANELIVLINKHPQVTAYPMEPGEFQDWDTMENGVIATIDQVKKNHVFIVRAKDSKRMMIQEYKGAQIV